MAVITERNLLATVKLMTRLATFGANLVMLTLVRVVPVPLTIETNPWVGNVKLHINFQVT